MISIDSFDPTPPYEQIRARIAEQIDDGRLEPGDRLPTVRQLAVDLGVATNTVARAFRELEQTGAVQTRGRAGTFVTGDQAERRAKEAAAAYWERAAELGLSAEAALPSCSTCTTTRSARPELSRRSRAISGVSSAEVG